MPNKDRRERAQMSLRNPLSDDVPITVVPDNQMPQYGAEVPARSTNKVLEDLLSMIRTHQKPVTIPFAAGTPTEARRQFDTGQEFSREKFNWEKDFQERQFAADQAYRNAQLALSRLRASGSGSSTETGYETPWGAIDTLISIGAGINDVMEYVNHPANIASYKKYGVTLDQISEYAQNRYKNMWQNVMEVSTPPKGAAPADVSRGFRQLESYAPIMTGQWQTGGKPRFSEADYRMFADATGKSVEEIKKMDELGWLEDFMKKFYGYQYKWEEPMGTETEELLRQITGSGVNQ
jgi:hypothetical protein